MSFRTSVCQYLLRNPPSSLCEVGLCDMCPHELRARGIETRCAGQIEKRVGHCLPPQSACLSVSSTAIKAQEQRIRITHRTDAANDLKVKRFWGHGGLFHYAHLGQSDSLACWTWLLPFWTSFIIHGQYTYSLNCWLPEWENEIEISLRSIMVLVRLIIWINVFSGTVAKWRRSEKCI